MALLSRSRAWHCSPETSRSAAAIIERAPGLGPPSRHELTAAIILDPRTHCGKELSTRWRLTELLHSTRWLKVTQYGASWHLIINRNGPLSNPTPAVRPWAWEPLFMPHSRRSRHLP